LIRPVNVGMASMDTD